MLCGLPYRSLKRRFLDDAPAGPLSRRMFYALSGNRLLRAVEEE